VLDIQSAARETKDGEARPGKLSLRLCLRLRLRLHLRLRLIFHNCGCIDCLTVDGASRSAVPSVLPVYPRTVSSCVPTVDGAPKTSPVDCPAADWPFETHNAAACCRAMRLERTSFYYYLFIHSLFACSISRSWQLRTPVPIRCPTRRWLRVAPPTLRPGQFPP
jgi:hypothetical protein